MAPQNHSPVCLDVVTSLGDALPSFAALSGAHRQEPGRNSMDNHAPGLKYFCLEVTQVTSIYTLFTKHATQPHLEEVEKPLREGRAADIPTPPAL